MLTVKNPEAWSCVTRGSEEQVMEANNTYSVSVRVGLLAGIVAIPTGGCKADGGWLEQRAITRSLGDL